MIEILTSFVLMSASINVVMVAMKKKWGENPFFKKVNTFIPLVMGMAGGIPLMMYYEGPIVMGIFGGFLSAGMAAYSYDLVKKVLERKSDEI